MSTEKDNLVRMRKLLTRKHTATIRKIKSISARVISLGLKEDEHEMVKRMGEKEGLCYALKVLDKTCQTEMSL